MLFDQVEQTDRSPARYSESAFGFMNRSSWRSANRIRLTLEEWFSHYPLDAADPAAERRDLRGRFRSRRNGNHYGAFFELFLHELLRRLECKVVVHPDPPGHAARPDFRVTSASGTAFYLEATVATGASTGEDAADARVAAVRDAVNQIMAKNFYLWMQERGSPRTPPKAAKIRAFLQRKLDQLDPDDITRLWEQGGRANVPTWTFKHEGWLASFQPIPKKPGARAHETERPIGGLSGEARRIDGCTPVREALLAKGQHLGDLDLPLVVAVNAMSWDTERDDVLEALFGRTRAPLARTSQGGWEGGPDAPRGPEGLWTSPIGPR